jgi:hypothetical protein
VVAISVVAVVAVRFDVGAVAAVLLLALPGRLLVNRSKNV